MSDTENKDTASTSTEDAETLAKGKEEKKRNDAVLAEQAEVKEAEQEAHEADPDQPEGQEPPSADQLRGEIAETREDLGDTVEALAAKTDVKGQAKDKADEVKAHARDKADEVKAQATEQKERAQSKVNQTTEQVKENPTPVAAIAGGVVALLLLIVFLKKRSS